MKKSREEEREFRVKNPFIFAFGNEKGGSEYHVHLQPNWDARAWGILVGDIIRNIAEALGVTDHDIWWPATVELSKPTTTMTYLSEEEAVERHRQLFIKRTKMSNPS